MSVDTALGNLAMLADGGPCRQHRHHATSTDDAPQSALFTTELREPAFLVREVENGIADPAVRAVCHMLLSFIFDLWRRNEYMYLALQNFGAQADPELSARIAVHSDMLGAIDEQEPVRWGDRARLGSAIVHRLLKLTEEDHLARMNERAAPVRAQIEQEEQEAVGASEAQFGHRLR